MTNPPVTTMNPDQLLEFVETLRARLLQAEQLRGEGETARADAVAPSDEELRSAVDALRLIRASRASAPAKRGKAAAPSPPKLTLADLIGAPKP